MIHAIFTISLLFATVVQAENPGKCKFCIDQVSPVCAKDGLTYVSYCVLKQQECLQGKEIRFACKGECPCDPIEVEQLDKKTVHKLQELRAEYQLEDEQRKELESDTIRDNLMLEILDDKDIKDDIDRKTKENTVKNMYLKEDEHKYYKNGSGDCPTEEMSDLPMRLIDWFHVLKTNEIEKEFKDQGIEREPALKGMKFMDSKMKSMYSDLACTAQDDDDIEKQVCLSPVKWMFSHLDTNRDSKLDAVELYEIEEINKEHCIKPFLKDCDSNGDGKVVLKEFCKCLCIAPPCTRAIKTIPTVLLRGVPRPFPGLFAPTCDEDGFFMPMQCNERTKECWCVDRNGAEYEGSRKKGIPTCGDNTKSLNENTKMIPLDMKKESATKE